MDRDQWRDFLREWFAVPDREGIYILGCYSRYLTLYSQQVRALNLVAGLAETDRISRGTRVLVVGAGAGGLTAAAAAAERGAQVTLLEKSEGPMEIQRNNRQRWIHPHIYDWPNIEGKYDYTVLPFLGWRASYAENVASQIVDGWEQRLQGAGSPPKAYFGVEIVRIEAARDGSVLVTWNGPGDGQGYFDAVLLAVGFGLERLDSYSDSYWAEDNLDGGFRSLKDQKWLISGFGDGGLTDLMRLCIKRFRHADVANLFAGARGIEGVKKDLSEILKDPRAGEPDFLTEQFNKLQTPGLEKVLEEKVRKDKPTVCLTGKTSHFYGPDSSVLNRLILLVLKRLGAWEYRAGPTDEKRITRAANGEYVVPLGPRRKTERFARVILRHGPEPALAQPPFDQILEETTGLKKRWGTLSRDRDLSRIKLWNPGYFGPEGSPQNPTIDERGRAYAEAVEKYKVRAKSLLVRADVRDNGNCTITFQLDGLEVLEGSLAGLHFAMDFAAGCIGPPEIDAAGTRLGLSWDEKCTPPATSVAEAVERVRKFSNTIRFRPGCELQAGNPVTFTVGFTVLNGMALTAWEFDHLYTEDERVHMNGDRLTSAREFLARVVWFPVETLKLRITLPQRATGIDRGGQADRQPFASFFRAPVEIPRSEVVRDSLLYLYPRDGSPFHPKTARWERDSSPSLVEAHNVRYDNNESKWELTIDRPPVGWCCSLDWDLPPSPEASEQFHAIENLARKFRARLLRYADNRKRRWRDPSEGLIREHFARLDAMLREIFRSRDREEAFWVSLLVYDDRRHLLDLVACALNGEEPAAPRGEFWLPFGLGLGGACFKHGGEVFVHRRAEAVNPEYYLRLAETGPQENLFSVPLDDPHFYDGVKGSPLVERGRQGIGVIDIGSDRANEKMSEMRSPEDFKALREKCQKWLNGLFMALPSVEGDEPPDTMEMR